MEPMMLTIPEAVTASRLSRTKLYEYATEGRITFRKSGKRTLVSTAELKALLEGLPEAAIACRSLTKPPADAA